MYIKNKLKTGVVISIIIILLAGAITAFAYIQKIGPFQSIPVRILPSNTAQEVTSSTDLIDTTSPDNNSAIDTIESTSSVTTTSLENSSSSIQIDLWTIFDKGNLALKNKDVISYNKYSYKQVTPEQNSQFIQFLPFLLDESSKINKSDYVNKWQDDKQAIYSTIPKKIDNTESYGYKQGIIMFINKDGFWKVLSMSPEKTWTISKKGTNHTATQIEQELQAMMLDSDKDGLTDKEETCTADHDPACVKTDPNKRDTNGNGWWDGIEAVMKI